MKRSKHKHNFFKTKLKQLQEVKLRKALISILRVKPKFYCTNFKAIEEKLCRSNNEVQRNAYTDIFNEL